MTSPAVDFQLSLQSESTRSAHPETPVGVEPGVSIRDVVVLLQANKAGAAIVCDDDRLVGIVTERDALRWMADDVDLDAPVSSVMSANPITVDSASTVGEAIRRMSEGGYRHLPLVDAADPTKPVGVVDVRGVLHYLVEHFPNTIYTLPPNPQRAPAEREGA